MLRGYVFRGYSFIINVLQTYGHDPPLTISLAPEETVRLKETGSHINIQSKFFVELIPLWSLPRGDRGVIMATGEAYQPFRAASRGPVSA